MLNSGLLDETSEICQFWSLFPECESNSPMEINFAIPLLPVSEHPQTFNDTVISINIFILRKNRIKNFEFYTFLPFLNSFNIFFSGYERCMICLYTLSVILITALLLMFYYCINLLSHMIYKFLCRIHIYICMPYI